MPLLNLCLDFLGAGNIYSQTGNDFVMMDNVGDFVMMNDVSTGVIFFSFQNWGRNAPSGAGLCGFMPTIASQPLFMMKTVDCSSALGVICQSRTLSQYSTYAIVVHDSLVLKS